MSCQPEYPRKIKIHVNKYMHFACFSLFFLTSIIENEQLLLFFPFFPLAKGIISRLQDTKSFPKASQLLFSQTTDTLWTKTHQEWENRILNSSSKHSAVKGFTGAVF